MSIIGNEFQKDQDQELELHQSDDKQGQGKDG